MDRAEIAAIKVIVKKNDIVEKASQKENSAENVISTKMKLNKENNRLKHSEEIYS